MKKVWIGILFAGLALWTLLFCPEPLEAGWAKTYGGGENEFAKSVQQTSDGGYIVAGYSNTYGAGNFDGWVVKLDADGNIVWQKTYGGLQSDLFYSVHQTSDGGYIIGGQTSSFVAGSTDIWILKLASDGAVEWQKTYGGAQNEYVADVRQTSDIGGYVVAGTTCSFGKGNCNAWILKLNQDGSIAWQKTYGGTGWEYAYSIRQTSDGGYIMAGETYSFSDDRGDAWIVKLDDAGTVEWEKRYGVLGTQDYVLSAQLTSDGGYIAAGMTKSFGASQGDAWVIKLNSDGTVAWEKRYGDNSDEYAYFVREVEAPGSGYIVAGRTNSFGQGGYDAWLLKLATDGTIEWQKTYGSGASEEVESISNTSDSGYIVAGRTNSFGAGNGDAWILKLDANGTIGSCPFEGVSTSTDISTTATVADTTQETTTTTVTGQDTSITAVSSSATESQVCPLSNTTYPLKIGITSKRQGTGTVTSGDRFIYCPGITCEYNYYEDILVTLIANADPLSTFIGWKPASLGCEGTDSCLVTMDKKKSVKAVFQGPNKLKVVTKLKNGAVGTVLSNDGNVNCPGDCEEPYKIGASVTLTAEPSASFVKWTGNPCKFQQTNVCTFTIEKNTTVKALFNSIP